MTHCDPACSRVTRVTPCDLSPSGGTDPRPLPLVPAAVQPERARVRGHLHPDRHARDARVCRPGRHQRLHLRALHGHEVYAAGRKVGAAGPRRGVRSRDHQPDTARGGGGGSDRDRWPGADVICMQTKHDRATVCAVESGKSQ